MMVAVAALPEIDYPRTTLERSAAEAFCLHGAAVTPDYPPNRDRLPELSMRHGLCVRGR
jgi:hypothetical protein